ncbi:MAG TPA: CCA tRNA nucleotidyltransferase [Acidisarcina sp.]
MPDYVYFLENRLSSDQQYALNQVRDAAREAAMTVFLTGGAVRDLTSGSPVRDLDFSVQGNPLKLKKTLEKRGGVIWGEHEPSQTLFLRFPGGARVEVSGIRREEHPKPGKTVYHPGTILEDLRRRDFTANAMALSLNEGSYGLLMDPLNGVADIESRLLRLVSNYGFIEEPVRLIRATRLLARMGWEMDEKTQTRFQNAVDEGMISALSAYHRGYELQEIGHEEDGLKILKVLEAQGWMKSLFPAWTSASADVAGLEQLREVQGQLQMQGVNPDTSAAQMELLTAKLPAKEIAALKHLFVRQGFVKEWERLEAESKDFAKILTGKQASSPSETWKLFTTSNAEAILWLGLTSKAAAVQAKFTNFFSVWPEARQRIPYVVMQEMRITPELPGYQDLLRQIFLQLIDGGLETEEKMRAFLEPFSPPAPPPPVSIRRTRGKKAGARARVELDDDDDEDAPDRTTRRGDDDKDDKEDSDEEDSTEAPLRLAPVVKAPVEAAPAPTAPATPIAAPVSVEARPTPPASKKAVSKAPVETAAPEKAPPGKSAKEAAKKEAAKPVAPAPVAKKAAAPFASKPTEKKVASAKAAPPVKSGKAAPKAIAGKPSKPALAKVLPKGPAATAKGTAKALKQAAAKSVPAKKAAPPLKTAKKILNSAAIAKKSPGPKPTPKKAVPAKGAKKSAPAKKKR